MKRLIRAFSSVIIAIVLCFCLIGCKDKDETYIDRAFGGRMGFVEKAGWSYVIYDKETKVMYLYLSPDGRAAGLTAILNEDGSPMLYEEDKE